MNRHEQRSAETQQNLLGAAEICFARYGYEATSVAQVCREAGVSKGAFYHHFDSKQALFLGLLEQWLAQIDRQIETQDTVARDAPGRLREITGVVDQVQQVPRQQLLIYLEFLNKAVRDPAVLSATLAPYHRYLDLMATMVQQGVTEGSIPPGREAYAAPLLMALIIGLTIQSFIDPAGADWAAVTREGIDLFLSGLQEARP